VRVRAGVRVGAGFVVRDVLAQVERIEIHVLSDDVVRCVVVWAFILPMLYFFLEGYCWERACGGNFDVFWNFCKVQSTHCENFWGYQQKFVFWEILTLARVKGK
jgi:hypothetical protein